MNDEYEPNHSTAAATVKKGSVAGGTAATEGTVSALRAGLTRCKLGNTQNSKLNWTEPEPTHGNQFNIGESGRDHHRAGCNAMSPAPDNCFLDLIHHTVSKKGNDVFATWYGSHGKATNEYTFGELWEEAGRISHYLRNEWNLKKGDRVVLCYNLGLHFFAVFLACLRAGVIAVLVYPPIPPLSQSLPKMNKVITDCDAHLILIDSDIAALRTADKWNPLSKTRQEWPDDNHLRVTNKLARSLPGQELLEFDEVTSPDDLAFFQYTSGSTGDPKGVMVTFGALSANVRMILNLIYSGAERGGIVVPSGEKRGFSWLPQYHDMGLIHGTIAPFAAGWRMHMMSPIDFIKNPLLWLDLMSRHHVHWGVAPDFAYSLVARKFIEAKKRNSGTEPIPGLDLCSIRFLNNAAEPIRPNTVETFGKIFAKYGLCEKWLVASYGLAEHVVGVCGVHGYHLSDPRDEDKFPLVACGSRGTFEQDQVVKIVDPKTLKEVVDGETGELWVSGPSVAAGYFKKPELTKEVFHAEMVGSERKFLRTGDLAFFQDDKLFICGRIKDLIIINGVNYYPQDIEYAVQGASPAVRPGCVAAFSSGHTGDCSDGLEVVFEIRDATLKDADEVVQAVRRSVTQKIGLLPSRIVAIKERTIPKTTSGKIKRAATRSSLYEGKLKVVSEDQEVSLGFVRTPSMATVASMDMDISANTNQGELRMDREPSCRSGTGTNRSTNYYFAFMLMDLVYHWIWTPVMSCLVFLSSGMLMLLRPGAATNPIAPHLIQHNLSFDDTSQRLPREAVAIIRSIQVSADKLNRTFNELGFHLIPEVAREWDLVDKSTSALQAMCETSMKAIEQHHPVLVQFAHLLLVHPDWISADNGKEILVDIVHCGFVLNWATCKIGTDTELMQRKMKLDAELERFLVAGHESVHVPEDIRFLVDGEAEDPLLGALDLFYWLKYRSVTYALKLLLAASKTNSRIANVGEDLLSLSILEAAWLDDKFGFTDNSFVGRWLAAQTSCPQEGCRIHLKGCSRFAEVYLSWNLASTMILEDPTLTIAILLIPCIVGCEADLFLWNLNISLYLVTKPMMARFLRGHTPDCFVLRSATEALGALNKKLATSLDPAGPPEQPAASWFRKLDKWEKKSVSRPKKTEYEETVISNNKQARVINAENVDLVRRTVASVLGVPPDEIPLDRPLAEIGMTSIMAIQLSDVLSCSMGREFPVTHLYGESATLETIAAFIEGLDLPTAMINWKATEMNAPNVTELRQSPLFFKRLTLLNTEASIPDSTEVDERLYPLTRVQQRMLLLQHMDPELGVYNNTINVKLLLDVSVHQLQAVFRALMKLHPVLCTKYIGNATSQEPTIGLVDLDLADEFVVNVLEETPLTEATLARIVQEPFMLQSEASLRVYYVPQTSDLVMVFPHIAFDGGSIWGLVSHLSELSKDPNWIPPKDSWLDYIDFAWREFDKEINSVPYDVSFWTDHLGLNEGSLPVLELPEDPERSRGAPFTQAVVASVDSTDCCLHKSVVEMSRLYSVTPFVLYMCVFEIVVKFFTGQNDLVLGIPINLRPRSHAHALGMFVNTIALRLRDFNSNSKEEQHEQDQESFNDLLQHRSMLWNSALEHADVPFDMVSSQTSVRKGVFQAILNYMGDLDIDDLATTRPSALFTRGPENTEQLYSLSKFDLEFTVNKTGMMVLARERIWSQTMLQRFLDCYVKLLADVTSRNHSLDTPCGKLKLLPENQTILLDSVLTGGHEVWADQLLMHEFFEKTVDSDPNNVAMRMMEKTMTYKYVEDRANQLAHYLLDDCGVRVEDRVGILLPRGFGQIIALLGILKAGCAYVPLDDMYPELKIAAIVEDSRMVACITTEHNGLCRHVRNCVSLIIEDMRLDEKSTRRPTEVGVAHDNLCYVLYTSGSTGTPKGVEIEHQSVCNLAHNLLGDYPRIECGEDNFLLTSRLSWDVSVGCIMYSFGSGGTLCLVPPELGGSLALNLNMLVSKMNIARLCTAPTLLQYLNLENRMSLRHITVGGEVVTPKFLKPFVKQGLYVTHAYGPTEATFAVTRHLVTDSDPCFLVGRSVSIGRPFPNVRLYVLDRHMNQVPVGVIGELYIGGVCLARGYTNEEETKTAFIDNPFMEQCAEELPDGVDSRRLYRTGDLVRVLADGSLDFVGRLQLGSSYIKLRGYRIEPGEVRAVLETHAALDRAVVMVDEPRQQLVAFVSSSKSVGEKELLEWCRSKLVDYAVPSKVIVLDGMPLDANGKINRKALLDSIPQALVHDEVVRPANEVEEMLVTVFGQVLSLPEKTVSVTADLFQAYGINSFTVAQFVSEIRRMGNLGELSMWDVFTAPTLRQLASIIIEKSARAPANLWDEVSKEVKHLQDLQDGQALNLPTEVPYSTKTRTVLVTDAVGYLGNHVLHRLLKATKGISLMLLVRAKDETEALERVHAALASNELLSRTVILQVKERCKMICGDLSLPNLGLDEMHFLQVGKQISAIVHCGQTIHHLASYDSLKPTNVYGTKEILRLSAASGSPLKTPVLYMSTASVFGKQTKDGAVNIMEDNDALDEHDKLSSGYAQSKWVAEQLCRGAQQQGWPVCILRIGGLLPKMGHQVWQEQSTVSAMLASFRMLGIFPADIRPSITTVDFAARTIVHILQRLMGNHPEKFLTTFHLCDPPISQVSARAAHRWLRIRGTPTRRVSFEEYLAILSEKAMSCPDPTIAVNLTTLEQLISQGASIFFDNSRLAGILEGSGIKMPRMSLRRFLKLYHSAQLFVQTPSGETFARSEVTQLHNCSQNKPPSAHSLSPFAGKGSKCGIPVEHVLTSGKTTEANIPSETSREGVESAVSKVPLGDTGSSEPDRDELADTKPKRNRTARMAAILRRSKENKLKDQTMTGALNDTATALSVASGKRAAGMNEELASFKIEVKKLESGIEKLMSIVEQIASLDKQRMTTEMMKGAI